MNQITHKQALKWIDRRLDGLLTDKQASFLEEHLRACDSCSAYAADMGLLPSYLQKGFHERWDEQPGPSQKVMQHVAPRARRIPLTNRVSSAFKLLIGATALIALGFAISFFISQLRNISPIAVGTEIVKTAPQAEDRLLVFASDQNGNPDIYTMHADGSRLSNLTNNPAYDAYPFWSPDGRQIAFESDRSGSMQIYLMDADGSNVIQLTNEEGGSHFDGNGPTPWSPDGRKLVFLRRSDQEKKYKLYSMDIEEKNKTILTNEAGEYLSPSWSPDGGHISFYEWQGGRMIKQVFVVDDQGNNLTRITASLPRGENFSLGDYYWSPDGKSIFFTADTNKSKQAVSTVYEAGLDGSLTVVAKPQGRAIDWWNGTVLQLGETPLLTWFRSDGSQNTLELCRSSDQVLGIAYKRSNNGNLVFGSNCSTTGWMLYWANLDGTITDRLLNSGIPAHNDSLFNMTWSPDDHFLAFVDLDTDSSNVIQTLYVLDVAEARKNPSTQPLEMANSYSPSWQPIP